MPHGINTGVAEVGAEAGVGVGPGVKVGARVHPETSLDVSSKGDRAPALTVTVKAAGAGEAERGQRGAPRAAAGVAAEARAPAGAAAGAGREARTGLPRRGAKSAKREKIVTKGGGS